MNSKTVARNVIARLMVKSGQIVDGMPYTLPTMAIEDIVIYLDHERIPEEIEHLNRCLNVTPEYRASESGAAYVREQEAKRAELLDKLEGLKELLADGDISAEDYTRLTTAQDYTGEHKQQLDNHMARFIPRWIGNGYKGAVYYVLDDHDETIMLRYENEQWIRCDSDPYGKNS